VGLAVVGVVGVDGFVVDGVHDWNVLLVWAWSSPVCPWQSVVGGDGFVDEGLLQGLNVLLVWAWSSPV
jgi:hypothetical protein